MKTKKLLLHYANHKGLKVWHTGGGCEALAKEMPDNAYCLITDGDAGIPESLFEPDCLLGIYLDDDIVDGIILFEGTAQQCIDILGGFNERQ
jgi:hypothetical protein